jgi:hypothetical protein
LHVLVGATIVIINVNLLYDDWIHVGMKVFPILEKLQHGPNIVKGKLNEALDQRPKREEEINKLISKCINICSCYDFWCGDTNCCSYY